MKVRNKVQKEFINSCDCPNLSMAGPGLFVECVRRWKRDSEIPISLFQ